MSSEPYLGGTGGLWDWDDFSSCSTASRIGSRKSLCLGLPGDHPPMEKTQWCNSDGLRELRRKLGQLETED